MNRSVLPAGTDASFCRQEAGSTLVHDPNARCGNREKHPGPGSSLALPHEAMARAERSYGISP